MLLQQNAPLVTMCSFTSREHLINNLLSKCLNPNQYKVTYQDRNYDCIWLLYLSILSSLIIFVHWFMFPGSKCLPPGTTVASPHCSQNGPDIVSSVVLSYFKHSCSKGCQSKVSCWDAPGSWIYSGWRVGCSSPGWRDWSARQQRKQKLRFPKSSLEGPQWEALNTLPQRGKAQNVQHEHCAEPGTASLPVQILV